ncbi:MAG: hypothetical protein JWO40_762 [Candidatus Doudnabacteria bacterium]|nr:hypothetical protein [Candidatus Doudnabacteria bacterium]
MEEVAALKELQEIFSQCAGFVLYVPTKSEVDYNDLSFPLEINKNNLIVIPKDKNSDPFEWADNCLARFKNGPVSVFIPGTMFDVYGTRHGKGAGWYDRFLSKIPSNWVKVGIIDSTKFSDLKLIRQEWDQPVNWIIVRGKASWRVYKARSEPHSL